MSSLDKHVIRKSNPYHYALFILLVVIITATAQWFMFKEDSASLQENLLFLQNNLNLSRQNTQQLSDERLDLREQNKILYSTTSEQKQELNIRQATVEELQLQLIDLQAQVFSLNKELMFYQNITDGNSSSELQIRELHLSPDPEQSDIINYRLVISQSKSIKKPIKGTVRININTDPTVISEHSLNLRYVQLIEGQLNIAGNRDIKTITVAIKQSKKSTLSRTFDWQLTPSIVN